MSPQQNFGPYKNHLPLLPHRQNPDMTALPTARHLLAVNDFDFLTGLPVCPTPLFAISKFVLLEKAI